MLIKKDYFAQQYFKAGNFLITKNEENKAPVIIKLREVKIMAWRENGVYLQATINRGIVTLKRESGRILFSESLKTDFMPYKDLFTFSSLTEEAALEFLSNFYNRKITRYVVKAKMEGLDK